MFEPLLIYLILMLTGIPLALALFKGHSFFEVAVYGAIMGLLIPNIIYASIWLITGLKFNLSYWLIIYISFFLIGVLILLIKHIKNKQK